MNDTHLSMSLFRSISRSSLVWIIFTLIIISFLCNRSVSMDYPKTRYKSSNINVNPQYLILFRDKVSINGNAAESHIQAFDSFMDEMNKLDSKNKLVDKFSFQTRGVNLTDKLRDELIEMSKDSDNIYGIISVEVNGPIYAFDSKTTEYQMING